MIASLVLAVAAYRLGNDHVKRVTMVTRGDLIFYPSFALAAATFTTAWIAGWMYHGVLGNKRRSLTLMFMLIVGVFVLFGLGPIVLGAMLGKGEDWVNAWRTYPMMA